ncbi:hypothetical protein TNCV_4136111 [Trichonephila clavipes]|nr:hypothetical protein TNCV_4136111 [Trichonephila clavipes]
MENTHHRPSGKRPKKGERFRGNQFMKVCPHTYVAERRYKEIWFKKLAEMFVCPLAERDNRRIFMSRQRRLESSFEAHFRPRKLKRVKKLSCFQEHEGISYDPGAF